MPDLSLLNSTIGPVMRGPSSSHAAGPYQIACTVRELAIGANEALSTVRIAFDPTGSFAAVYSNQGSDEGFAAGFLNIALTDEAYLTALEKFSTNPTLNLEFVTRPLVPNDHPNRTEIEVDVLTSEGDTRTEVFRAVSTGGGMFLIDEMKGTTIDVTGSTYTLIIEGDSHQVSEMLSHAGIRFRNPIHIPGVLTQFSLFGALPEDIAGKLANLEGVQHVRLANPTQLVVDSTAELPLTAAELLATPDVNLSSLAVELESIRLGLPVDEIREHFLRRTRLMLESVTTGLSANPDNDRMHYLSPTARNVQAAELPTILSANFMQSAISAALAVMEQDSNRGVIVAAPTAGSSGIVPGILYALSAAGVDENALTDALQVMALVGGAFATRGTFAAEMGGCSVETGASAAMAAGGLTYALGGSAKQVFQAASMCLMNTLGLVCDPAGGDVEIPCHARNIAGVSHAHSATTATLAGFDAVLDFDDMVQATIDVGKLMHPDLRCTGRAGCATYCTPKTGNNSNTKTVLNLTRRRV